MNLVFLLLTTAASAGAPPAPPGPAPAAPPAVAPAPIADGGCGCDCGCATDCCKPSFFDRFRGMFAGKCCDTCDSCDTCDTCAPAKPACDTCAPAKAACAPAKAACGCDTCDACDDCCKPSFFDRFRGLFSRKCCDTCDSCDSGCGCANGSCGGGAHDGAAAPAVGAPLPGGAKPEPLQMPKGEPEPKKTIGSTLTPTSARIETESKNPFELDRRYEKRVSRAADYSTLTGQLFFVHVDGGLWVLRYAPLSQEDVNGGSVILARDRKMDNYREGDLVTVEGQVSSQRGSSRLGAPLYRVQTISLVDRPLQ